MTNDHTTDIETFCSISAHIPRVQMDGEPAWFILSSKLREKLGIPDDFDHEQLLGPKDCTGDQFEFEDGTSEWLHIITESGLYKLILAYHAPAFTTFKNWVTKVVGPIVGHEGFFMAGEERFYTPLGKDHEVQDCDLDYQFWLAEDVLPEIRKNGFYADGSVTSQLQKIVDATKPAQQMMNFLERLKGDRSRLKLTAQ